MSYRIESIKRIALVYLMLTALVCVPVAISELRGKLGAGCTAAAVVISVCLSVFVIVLMAAIEAMTRLERCAKSETE